jgi:putative transposase
MGYRSTKPDQAPLRLRILDLAKTRVRYGYFRIYILLRWGGGWSIISGSIGFTARRGLRPRSPRRHVSAADRERQPAATRLNELWSMGFFRLRALTVVGAFAREALAIEVDQGIRGEQAVEVMTRLAFVRGAPATIKVDNGPEFVPKALDRWAYANGGTLDFGRPDKPTDNARGILQRPVCEMSASTHTGSCRWPTQRPRSRRGITMRAILTLPWGGARPKSPL